MAGKGKKQEAVVLLMDVGANVSLQDSGGQSFLNKSKQIASRIIQRKIFSEAKGQFSLILIGSKETDNEMDYPNIQVKDKWMVSPNWDLLREIENLTATNVTTADWFDGLVVAVNLLKHESECKAFSELKIVMLTNFSTPTKSIDQVDYVIESLRDLNINLVVIGLQMDENESEGEDLPVKSKIQKKGEALIGRILEEAEGISCGFDEAMCQLDHFQKCVGRSQPWYCDLQIGENIFIPITGYKKFAPKEMLKWKKKGIDDNPITQETVCFHGDTQVEKTDVIKGYLFGQTVVPISEDDKTSMALTTEKSFQLVGFTKKKNVPRHILLGDSTHYIAPRSNVQSASKAVTALVKALLVEEKVGIVRKVYCKNSVPRLGVLTPTYEQESYFFYFTPLPFAEDEHYTKLPSLKKVQPSQSQLETVDRLIEDMDLTEFEEDEDPYSKLVNPSVEHMNSLIVFKAMNPNSALPKEPSNSIKTLLQPKLEILNKASSTLQNIKSLFQLEEVEQKKYRKDAVHISERNSDTKMEVEEDVKPQILIDSMVDFVQSTVTEIGTIDPVGNFHKLLQLKVPFRKLCEQMQDAIKKLLLISSNTAGMRKPLSALAVLREHCVKQDPSQYNTFIAKLKDDVVERNHIELWDLIVQDKLGLITSAESPESVVSADEADIFYQIKKAESQQDISYEMEAEEMLDMI